MKRVLFILFAFISIEAYAQDNSMWLQKGEDMKLTFEFKNNKENVFNYLYAESVFDKDKTGSAYIQYARDQKWWEAPVYAHAEFRSFIDKDGISEMAFIVGPSFTLLDKSFGFMYLQPLYRYNGKHNYQLTLLTDMEYKRLYYTMFADMYGTEKVFLHSENRFFFKVVKSFRVGLNCILTVNELKNGIKIQPLGVIRIDL